jgi:HEAT repeat protein
MPVTMEQVLSQLDREEPEYKRAAQLGRDALPHLLTLIQGADLGLAAKAASLAGLIDADQSAAVLEKAAQHPEPVVRVAAAAAASHLTTIPTSLAMGLLNDSDAGVRKWTLTALEGHNPPGVRRKVEEIMNADPDVGLRNRARAIVQKLP